LKDLPLGFLTWLQMRQKVSLHTADSMFVWSMNLCCWDCWLGRYLKNGFLTIQV